MDFEIQYEMRKNMRSRLVLNMRLSSTVGGTLPFQMETSNGMTRTTANSYLMHPKPNLRVFLKLVFAHSLLDEPCRCHG